MSEMREGAVWWNARTERSGCYSGLRLECAMPDYEKSTFGAMIPSNVQSVFQNGLSYFIFLRYLPSPDQRHYVPRPFPPRAPHPSRF